MKAEHARVGVALGEQVQGRRVAPPRGMQRNARKLGDDASSPTFIETVRGAGYRFRVTEEGKYRVVLSSDNGRFGGFDRPDEDYAYETYEHQLSLYLPSRVALVLAQE